jgi:HAD superfamily phosphoserine phosphatase-like hydrolase
LGEDRMQSDGDAIADVLELLQVPTMEGVYVLGCFARYGTLYSQQVRALNLICALHESHNLPIASEVAVIGAGAAGLTAAIGAARAGANVTLLEKLDGPMGVQRNSLERYIHPHIYDWPSVRVPGDGAGLPFLDWQAGNASEVSAAIKRSWEEESRGYQSRIRSFWEVKNVWIHASNGDGKIDVGWGPQSQSFDKVIIAVGYGLEPGQWPFRRYWQNDQLDDRNDGLEKKCLVSGCGDGGLIDLMRLCIKNFRHHEIVNQFSKQPALQEIGKMLLEKEKTRDSKRRDTYRYYQGLREPAAIEILKPRIRTDTKVYLTGKHHYDIYASRSAILNRFVVSQLGQLMAWTWVPGPVSKPVTQKPGERYIVRFGKKNGKSTRVDDFDVVVLRHGPTSALKDSFSEILTACKSLATRWEELPVDKDPTRLPLAWGNLFDRPRMRVIPRKQPPVGGYKLVVFDIDGTLLQGDRFKWSWKLIWKHLGFHDSERDRLMRRFIKPIEEGADGWETKYQEWCDASARLFRERGLKRSDFARIAEPLTPVAGLRETIASLKTAGMKLAVVSGGVDCFLIEKMPDYKQLFDYVFVNEFIFNDDGMFLKINVTPYDFKGKLTAIHKMCEADGISTEQVVFVGDGFNDLAVLPEQIPATAGKDAEPVRKIGLTISFAATDSNVERRADENVDTADLRLILEYIQPKLDD